MKNYYINGLTFHRKGCIVCIDYRHYAKAPYIQLYRNFKKITDIMYLKLLSLINVGFNPSNGYMFGFSYGGQLATQIGAALKPHFTFYNIDTCDMAGPGFDLFNNFDHTIGAELVQCLHSSRDKGTAFYTCHQNVRLGKCGYTQAAVISQNRFSNHGLCVQIYINAFDYPFYAICNGQKLCGTTSAAVNIPRGYTIGYKENPNMNITGEIFVPTSANFPYNVQQDELLELSYC
ncbi:uncharacterized protein LOC119679401 isoform X2 [Teleopsis dalmanni]|uniref:uncharacterized protein LOC119679401 isoform X2 n=1 Tax=Teleopsis dalmanni TaxID=139649 RepID=UPI0018CE11A1|nr:uncharacterized protein LOC119679401 isoform X2 [Teleopsis dalmanni]